MEHYQSMLRMCMIVTPICAILLALSTYGWNYYGLKIKELEKQEKLSPVKEIKISGDTYNLKNSVVGDGNTVTYNESLEEQRLKKIKQSVKNLYSDNAIEVEVALKYLKDNPEFTDKQINMIMEVIKLAKFRNAYQEDLIWLLAQRKSAVATKYFGELLPWGQYYPSVGMQYFSRNNIDFDVFTKYMREAIITTGDKTTITSVVVLNSSFNKDYIIKFLNSKELIDLIFLDLHPNYAENFKRNIDRNDALNYISKKEFEESYFYFKLSKL